MSMLEFSCQNCGRPFPSDGLPYRCPRCSGLYDARTPLPFDPARLERDQPGIWRYRHTFGLPRQAESVSLGEGDTPLIWADVLGRKIAFKCEHLNPTGSFKDRGSAPIAAWLHARGIREAVEDSSGNAGASFAAYAARAGIRARVFIPARASGPKRLQIESCGADVVPIEGSRSDVSEAVRRVAEQGAVYASHAFLPFNSPGYATLAYELVEQLQAVPSAVVVPAGQGGLLLGVRRGFEALRRTGSASSQMPRFIGVQARACAPLWALATLGPSALTLVAEGATLAEGVRVRAPVRGDAVLEAVRSTGGSWIAVDEADILRGRDELAHRGFYVEPTSAIVWSALEQCLQSLPDPVVVILTGTGYKFSGT